MSMGGDKLVSLRCNGMFYTGVIFQGLQQWLYKVTVDLCIQIIGTMRERWYKVFLKLRVYFGGILSRKKVF